MTERGSPSRVRQFYDFWFDFVVGDDWRVAVGVVVALGATAVVSRADVHVWWIVPAAVLVLLPLSLWVAIRRDR